MHVAITDVGMQYCTVLYAMYICCDSENVYDRSTCDDCVARYASHVCMPICRDRSISLYNAAKRHKSFIQLYKSVTYALLFEHSSTYVVHLAIAVIETMRFSRIYMYIGHRQIQHQISLRSSFHNTTINCLNTL